MNVLRKARLTALTMTAIAATALPLVLPAAAHASPANPSVHVKVCNDSNGAIRFTLRGWDEDGHQVGASATVKNSCYTTAARVVSGSVTWGTGSRSVSAEGKKDGATVTVHIS